MATSGISGRQRRFLTALMTSPTVKQAAAAAKVGERTAYKYLTLPAVRAELSRLQDDCLAQAARETMAAMSESLLVLRIIARDPGQPAGARVSAARAIRESGTRLAEQVILSDRVTALEVKINER